MSSKRSESTGVSGKLLTGGITVAIVVLMSAAVVRLRDERPRDGQPTVVQPPVVAISVDGSPTAKTNMPLAPSVARVTTERADQEEEEGDSTTEPAPLLERVVGTWRSERHKERTITITADGTATAVVQLDMFVALLYGPQLTLNLTWTLEGDVMTQAIESGTPAEAVRWVKSQWGGIREYRVVEASGDRMILAKVDDESDQQVWLAVQPDEADPSADDLPNATINEKSPR